MKIYSRISRIALMVAALSAGASLGQAQGFFGQRFEFPHPAIGSWFGRAVELCAPGDATCPKAALFMTPTITSDGNFIGNDSLTLAGPPFGPHTTAHGHWVATSGTDVVVDYVFMLPGTDATTVNALRFRWQASVNSYNTMVGFVNIYFGPPIPVKWEALATGSFPSFPDELQIPLISPAKFYTDAAQCPAGPASGCPLIFKFQIQRVIQ